MGRVETFDHTADLGLRIYAADLLGPLRARRGGTLRRPSPPTGRDVRPEQSETVRLTADSTLELLVDWLNELIFRSETEHRLYGRFDVALDLRRASPRRGSSHGQLGRPRSPCPRRLGRGRQRTT